MHAIYKVLLGLSCQGMNARSINKIRDILFNSTHIFNFSIFIHSLVAPQLLYILIPQA